MFALSGSRIGNPFSPKGAGEVRVRVLPRPLRRFARFLTALATGGVDVPRHAGSWLSGGFLAATIGYGLVLGGHVPATAGAMTAALGFTIEKVAVAGNAQTSDIDVLQQIGLDGASSLVMLDGDSVRGSLIELPWVKDASVRKVYPGTVSITLVEREPFAIWQHGHELTLIESTGEVIAPFAPGPYSHLPLFVGLGADSHAAEFERMVRDWPAIREQARAFVRVANRRWDIRLDNGITIKLPEHGVTDALADIVTLNETGALLSRDISVVDMRLGDRVTVRLTETGLESRQQALAEREKALKIARKHI